MMILTHRAPYSRHVHKSELINTEDAQMPLCSFIVTKLTSVPALQ